MVLPSKYYNLNNSNLIDLSSHKKYARLLTNLIYLCIPLLGFKSIREMQMNSKQIETATSVEVFYMCTSILFHMFCLVTTKTVIILLISAMKHPK